MSDATKAVFLSYASQDAAAARRICDALRAVGVEVWFDQNELVGGDQWDQKIRGQVKACALFVPVISAATQARLEGYFRLEWKLAAQRTHTMADAKPFLLPVVIDATRDAEAHVPEEFRAVQWTRLTAGETPPAFCARVKKLLGGEVAPVSDRRSEADGTTNAGQRPALPRKQSSRPWLVPTLIGAAALAALALWHPWRGKEKPESRNQVTASSSTASEIARMREGLLPDRWHKEDFEAVSATVDRLIQIDPESSDAWALRSIINSLQVLRVLDSGTKPLEAGKTAAERALRYAPDSPLAKLALGMHLTAMISRGGDPQAARPLIDGALASLPLDSLTRYAGLASAWLGYDFETVDARAKAWIEAEPQSSYPKWILEGKGMTQRRLSDVEKWAEQAATDPNITGVRALEILADANYYLRADLPKVRATLDRVPTQSRSEPFVVYLQWQVSMAERKWDGALQGLARMPDAFIVDKEWSGPKAVLAGLAHQRAGRTEAAGIQFGEAVRALKEKLATDSDNEEWRAMLAASLAYAGRTPEARAELALVEPLIKARAPTVYRAKPVIAIAQTYAALGDAANLAFWLRKQLAEPSTAPFTPASLRIDPRFTDMLEKPEIVALLKEFASLDQPAAGTTLFAPAVSEKSLVVLPLENLSPDPENAFFTDGMHAEVISTLSQIADLKVISRNSALAFKGSTAALAEIAQKLGVANVITGSVRRAGNIVRIQIELRRASDEALLWSLPKGDRDLKDVLGLQSEIADQVARVLQARTDKGSSAGARFLAAEPRVYDLYLKAHELYDANPSNRRRINECVAMMDEALRLDPKFMPAARLVGRLNVRLFLLTDEPEEKLRYATEARKWGEQSSRLMPGGAGDTALAFYYAIVEGDHERSLRYAENAIHALPNDAEGFYFAGVALRNLGRPDEAARRFVQAEALDVSGVPSWNQHIDALADLRRGPACEEIIAQYLRIKDQVVSFGSGAVATARFKLDGTMPAEADVTAAPGAFERATWVWRARRFEEVVALCDARLAAGVVGTTRFAWLWRKSDALARLKRNDDAMAAARKALAVAEALKAAPKVGPSTDDGRFAIAFARLGRGDEAVAKARSQIEAVPAVSLGTRWSREIDLAGLYALLNRARDCVELLAKLLRVPSGLTVPILKIDPMWDNVREDAGFKALLADPKNSAPL